MGLYRLFSYNVEVQYKSYFLSKAMLFTVITTLLNIILPFLIAYKSREKKNFIHLFVTLLLLNGRTDLDEIFCVYFNGLLNGLMRHLDPLGGAAVGFWLKTHSFYEQPNVHFTYEYMLVAETDDPSQSIVCGEANGLNVIENEENCAEMQVQEYDNNVDGKNDILDFKFHLNIPQGRTIASVILILSLDFQLMTTCPVHMQSLAVVSKEFVMPPSRLKYYGDLQFYQVSHLPCKSNHIDTKYNSSLFNDQRNRQDNIIDFVLEHYFIREVTTHTKTIHSRSENGHTGFMKIQTRLRIPEMKMQYIPSIMQELKWAWPQYLSMVLIFYWMFNEIKRFVFNHRLLMAWKIAPWKKGC